MKYRKLRTTLQGIHGELAMSPARNGYPANGVYSEHSRKRQIIEISVLLGDISKKQARKLRDEFLL